MGRTSKLFKGASPMTLTPYSAPCAMQTTDRGPPFGWLGGPCGPRRPIPNRFDCSPSTHLRETCGWCALRATGRWCHCTPLVLAPVVSRGSLALWRWAHPDWWFVWVNLFGCSLQKAKKHFDGGLLQGRVEFLESLAVGPISVRGTEVVDVYMVGCSSSCDGGVGDCTAFARRGDWFGMSALLS